MRTQTTLFDRFLILTHHAFVALLASFVWLVWALFVVTLLRFLWWVL